MNSFSPIVYGRTAVGLKEYMPPPYPLEISGYGEKIYIESRASDTLTPAFCVDGKLSEMSTEGNRL